MKRLLFGALAFSLIFWAGCSDDPDGPITITVEDTTVLEPDVTASADIVLTLSSAAETDITFDYTTTAGTAIAGEDFIAATNKTFTIPAGRVTAKLDVLIVGDTEEETPPTETFEITFSNVQGATFTNSTITVTIQDNDGANNPDVPSTGYTTPESYAGYTLVWQDEFNGNALSDDWTHETGNGTNGWGNWELQYYRPENTTVAGGYLFIEAKRENFGGKNYTSSRIVTQNKQSFQFGRIDIRAALPKGRGLWPALWMLGSNITSVGWPACGEIDIMELIGSEPNKVLGTAHWDNTGQPANFGGTRTLPSGDFSEEFHVFSIIWNQNAIRWFVDDVQYHVIDITPADLSELRNGDYFFIFNVAVGGTLPGDPDGSTPFPQKMIVDYVRVFQ